MLRPMIVAPVPSVPSTQKSSSTPSSPPFWPIIRRAERVANIHVWRSSPPTPRGSSTLWSGPATKPSTDIARLCTRNRAIAGSLALLAFASRPESTIPPSSGGSTPPRTAPCPPGWPAPPPSTGPPSPTRSGPPPATPPSPPPGPDGGPPPATPSSSPRGPDVEPSLDESYDEFPRIEEEFGRALDESLDPRGPDVVYEVAASLGLPPGARALDVGCGEGRDVLALADRFGWVVAGVDPVRRNLEVAREEAGGARLAVGDVRALPVPDGALDVVWCREVLSLVSDLSGAFAEVRRVLRPGGRAVVVQVCRTERLVAEEATGFLADLGDHPSADELHAASTGAGLRLDERVVLSSEGGEWGEERS